MTFYQSISEYYDHIFPLNRMQLDFIKAATGTAADLSVLDIGCGTGSLSIELAGIFSKVTGIDPDISMLNKAKDKAKGKHSNLHFSPYGMLELRQKFGAASFDTLVCFGNTLVHLDSNDNILSFLQQAKHVLKTPGKLLIQIINYDRIIDQNIKGLPSIENECIKFTRKYVYHPKENLLDFETILTIKADKREIRNTIHLYPIRQVELLQLVRQSGFSDIRVWGNFKREALAQESIPLVIEALA